MNTISQTGLNVCGDQVVILNTGVNIEEFLDAVFKIGCIFITDELGGFPGVGMWELLPDGVTIVSADDTDPAFAVGAVGGEAEKKLIYHNHNLPSHTHTFPNASETTGGWNMQQVIYANHIGGAAGGNAGIQALSSSTVQSAGSTDTGLNKQPGRSAFHYRRVS